MCQVLRKADYLTNWALLCTRCCVKESKYFRSFNPLQGWSTRKPTQWEHVLWQSHKLSEQCPFSPIPRCLGLWSDRHTRQLPRGFRSIYSLPQRSWLTAVPKRYLQNKNNQIKSPWFRISLYYPEFERTSSTKLYGSDPGKHFMRLSWSLQFLSFTFPLVGSREDCLVHLDPRGHPTCHSHSTLSSVIHATFSSMSTWKHCLINGNSFM